MKCHFLENSIFWIYKMSEFLNFLQEADGLPPMGGGAPMGGMGGPPMGGGMGGMGGGLGGPMGGMGGGLGGPMGGMGGGLGGPDPLAPQGGMGGPQGNEIKLTPSDVWTVLEKIYGNKEEDSPRKEDSDQVSSKVQKKPKHLMGLPD